MPMVSYSSAEGRVRVMLEPGVPQLTPLMVSHPGDGFAPDDPWFVALDPVRRGLAFSRRYGFVMATMTDPLPAGTTLALRKVSGSAALEAYRYANTPPKAFEPIFGTAGSPAGMPWNGMMFHPTFAAPPGTNTYEATFEAYVQDAATGVPIANTSSEPFTLTWTSVPDGRPVLTIATRVMVAWPTVAGTWVLEAADAVPDGTWAVVAATPTTIDGQTAVVLEPAAVAKVYRLRRVP